MSPRTLTSILGAVVAGAVGLWGWDSVNNPSHNGSQGGGSSTESSSGPSGGFGSGSSSGSHKGSSSSIPACNANQLPDQARVVVDDIKSGGPFDYPQKDGSTSGIMRTHSLTRRTTTTANTPSTRIRRITAAGLPGSLRVVRRPRTPTCGTTPATTTHHSVRCRKTNSPR